MKPFAAAVSPQSASGSAEYAALIQGLTTYGAPVLGLRRCAPAYRKSMAVEIETKIKVDDLSAIRAKLQGSNAKLLGKHLEINTFFDTEDRSLLAADKGLR